MVFKVVTASCGGMMLVSGEQRVVVIKMVTHGITSAENKNFDD